MVSSKVGGGGDEHWGDTCATTRLAPVPDTIPTQTCILLPSTHSYVPAWTWRREIHRSSAATSPDEAKVGAKGGVADSQYFHRVPSPSPLPSRKNGGRPLTPTTHHTVVAIRTARTVVTAHSICSRAHRNLSRSSAAVAAARRTRRRSKSLAFWGTASNRAWSLWFCWSFAVA